MSALKLGALAVLAFLLASCDCVVGGSDGDVRTITITTPADATGSGWVDVYVPAFEAGAEHVGCYVEPGFAGCERTVPAGAAFEVLATGDYQSTFIEWGGDCSGPAPLCPIEAADGSVSLSARFEGNVATKRLYLDSLAINGAGTVASSLGTQWRPPQLGVSASEGPLGGPGVSIDDTPGATQPLDVPLEGGLALTLTVIPDSGHVATRIEVFSLGFDTAAGERTRLFACQALADSCAFTLQYADYLPDEHLTMWIQFEDAGAGSSGAGLAPGPTETPAPTEAAPNLSGDWALLIDVTRANGVCAGEENDPPYEETVTIAESGGIVQVTGIRGAAAAWTGSFDGQQLVFGGEKSDGSGTTTVTMSFTYKPATDTMTGTESWSWSGGSGECPNGLSSVGAQRAGSTP